MAMSVGTCECGCGEFDHGVGGWEELEEHEHDRWQKHRCGPDCVSPCLVARCRESDGFWTWCPNCDVLCSGWFEEWSDEPHEEGVLMEEPEPRTELTSNGLWPPNIGTEVQVGFADRPLSVVDWVCLSDAGDPVRLGDARGDDSFRRVYAIYAVVDDGSEVLIFPDDIV